VSKSPPIAFDFVALEARILEAARQAFREVAAAHPEQQLCAFALYSDDGAMTVCPSINTIEHLTQRQRQHPDDAAFYKFATPEWRFEATGADLAFQSICDDVRGYVLALADFDGKPFTRFRDSLFETCLRVLERLRTEEPFRGDNVLLVFAVSDSDPDIKTELARMKRLNAAHVVAEFRRWTKTWR